MDFNLLLEDFLTTMLIPANFLFVLVGITAGIIVGALPGLIASFMEYCNFPVSPILPALILGPMAEQNLRRSLIISHGDPAVFFTRPISAALIILAVIVIITSYHRIKKATTRIEKARAEQTAGL